MRQHAASGSRKSRRAARDRTHARGRAGRHFSRSQPVATAAPVAPAAPAAATESDSTAEPTTKRSWGWFARLGVAAGVLAVVGGVAVALLVTLGKPHVAVTPSSSALVDFQVGGFGATVTNTTASVDGREIALVRSGGGLIPARALPQGQAVKVSVTASAPSWLRWLFGNPASAVTTVTTPSVSPAAEVAVAADPGQVEMRFSGPVSEVRYSFDGAAAKLVRLSAPSLVADLTLPTEARGGSLSVDAAATSWEMLAPQATTVSYFVAPPGGAPVALATPAPGSTDATSDSPITLTFDQPIAKVLGTTRPTISPSVAGTWSEPAANVLIFTPSGFGYGPDTTVTVSFDRPVSAVGATSSVTTASQSASDTFVFQVGAASLLRMEQILAELHYLPLDFVPAAGATQPSSFQAEVASMTSPPAGSFAWRWSSTPAPLKAKWVVGSDNEMLKGALMAFLSNRSGYDGYQAEVATVSQLATSTTWQELLQAAASNQVDPNPYSYVYVTETLPETLTLWENGSVVLTALANTGIPGRTTALGTYPIYVRYTVNYMDGTNPDGSKYHDLVHWINYFTGGDAVHGFVRGSYGYPQSLGCVELPVSTAQTAFSDLAVGDLVTVTPA